MFAMISGLFNRDGKQRHNQPTGLRGLLQRVTGGSHMGGNRTGDHQLERGRWLFRRR